MTTFLAIVLVALCLFNIWLSGYTIKREKARRRQLRERMDEYDGYVEEHVKEMARLTNCYNDAVSCQAHMRATIKARDEEIEELKRPHGCGCDCKPETPEFRAVNLAALDLQDLRASYDELAKSYDFVSCQYENPSKRYIISNLVKLYDVKNLGSLAKALGVSTSSLSQKIKK